MEPIALGAISTENSLVVRVDGHLETATVPVFRGELSPLLEAVTYRRLVLDLDGLETLSAAGVHLLRELTDKAAARNVRLVLACRPGSGPRRVLEQIDSGLGVTSSVSEALAFDVPPGDGVSPSPAPESPGVRFTDLTELLISAATVGEVLQHLVDTAVSLVPEADLISITLRDPDGRFHTAAYTDDAAAELDALQYELGEGPCHDAALPDGPEFVERSDLCGGSPWPRWGAAAAGLGWRAVLATALVGVSPPRFSGALNFYSREPDGLRDADRDIVLLLATHATLAVAETDAVQRGELHEAQLREALRSRDVIGQAKGIIMARRGLDADEAFELLRRTSQQLNVKLVKLAATLAARHGELDEHVPPREEDTA